MKFILRSKIKVKLFILIKINEITNSITNNDKTGFNKAIHRLNTNIDNYTQNNYIVIISMKD